jgi:AraC family transcriptional regulator
METTGVVTESGGLPGSRLRRVTEYIENNLHRELRLSELSSLVHMSPYHFARLFKQRTGMPPHRFVLRRRIDEAAALLATQGLSVNAIARSVGFRTQSHFSTTFRRFTRVAPTAYRNGGVADAETGRQPPASSNAVAFLRERVRGNRARARLMPP